MTNVTAVVAVFEDEKPKGLPGGLADLVWRMAFQGRLGAAERVIHRAGGRPGTGVLLGLGPRASFSALAAERAGAALAAQAGTAGTVQVHLPEMESSLQAHFALGARLQSYRFKGYGRAAARGTLKMSFARPDTASLDGLAAGVEWARDLVTMPPNILTPKAFAAEMLALRRLGVKVTVYDEAALKKKGFEALLAVGRGSSHPPRLATLEWRGGKNADAPLVVVGKGVTFDSGGHWLKPGPIMDLMKFDMAGAAAVAGAVRVLAARGARANVVGIVALAENMLDGNAYRPGDVVRSLSGQTIEVINTDAEGRIILADALHYACTAFRPRAVIDLATLTGAIVTALGSHCAGLYATDDALAADLIRAGQSQAELLWRMPLAPEYDALIDTDIADVKNLAKPGLMGLQEGGPSVAAQFLRRFVTDVPWAHIDMAGTAWRTKGIPTVPAGASGFGVRLLNEFVAATIETTARR